MRTISRRTAIGMSAVAMVGLMLPKSVALATEPELQEDGDESRAAIALCNCLVTGNPTVDERNKEVGRQWDAAVAKALDEGSEIITVVSPEAEHNNSSGLTRATHVVSTNSGNFADGGPWINVDYYLSAMYDINGNWVTNFRNHTATVVYGLYSPSIQMLGYTYTVIDGGRTFAVRTTLSVTCYVVGVARSAQWQAYSEFSSSGGAHLY